MAERRRHFAFSFGLTLVSIAATEIAHHVLHVDATLSAGIFLLGLVPVAYGALMAGVWAGVACTLPLALYVLHYSGEHDVLVTLSAWPSAAIVVALGLALSWPMHVIRRRERRIGAELHQRTLSLERRYDELAELNAALESFGYVVGHDLKEPVRAIENYLSAAEEEWGSKQARGFVKEAHLANRRLADMLQGLLDYSRTSSLPTTARALRIDELLRSDICTGRFERIYKERGVHFEIEADLPEVLGDEVLLCQALGNLLLNAARHNPSDKPVVRVGKATAPAGRAHIVVADNGPGFPPEVLSRFRRLPEKGLATVKTGFGLVIAQRAVRRLDGEMWLDNAPEGGARAHVELPAG